MAEPVPAWKFYHPLPIWQVLVIAFIAQIVATIPIVALREGLGLNIPVGIAGGIGGLLMVFAVRFFAARRLAADKK